MYRNFLLLMVLCSFSSFTFAGLYKCKDANGNISFSDTSCKTETTVENSSLKFRSAVNNQADQVSSNSGAYTKDLPAMQAPDDASKSCLNYVNTTARYPDPSTTKLLTSEKKWVSVKDVGARQMVTISVTSKNEAGMYVGVHLHSCLLMGDGVTINTYPYELL